MTLSLKKLVVKMAVNLCAARKLVMFVLMLTVGFILVCSWKIFNSHVLVNYLEQYEWRNGNKHQLSGFPHSTSGAKRSKVFPSSATKKESLESSLPQTWKKTSNGSKNSTVESNQKNKTNRELQLMGDRQRCVFETSRTYNKGKVESPQILLNPDRFLYPGLVWGPGNQMVGLWQSMYLAIRLNR